MSDELTWLQLLARTEERIESLFTDGKKYLPSVLMVNRELRDFCLCILEDKDYWEEKRKRKLSKETSLTDVDIISWMYRQ